MVIWYGPWLRCSDMATEVMQMSFVKQKVAAQVEAEARGTTRPSRKLTADAWPN